MRVPTPNRPRFPRPGGRRSAAGGRRHVVLIAAAALAVLAAAVVLAQMEGLFGHRAATIAVSDAELYGGTIQLAASGANLCRRLSFDNRSGELLDRGVARCRPPGAAQDGSGERQPAGNNLDQIRDGFLRR